MFGTTQDKTRQDLYRDGCVLQFNIAIYHSPYLSMKISFNRGKSHLILFSSSFVVFSFFFQERFRKKTRSRESFSTRRWDLVGNCISISFVSLCKKEKKIFHGKVMNVGKLFLCDRNSSFQFLMNFYDRETISKEVCA